VLKKFVLILVLFSASSVVAQLNRAIEEALALPPDSTKVDALIEISKIYSNINIDSAYFFTRKAENLAKNIDYEYGLIAAKLSYGNLKTYESDYDQAIELLQEANRMAEKHNYHRHIAASKLLLGNVYNSTNDHEAALKVLREGLAITIQNNNHRTTTSIYVSIGLTKRLQNQTDSALMYYQQALTVLTDQYSDSVTLAAVYNNMGSIYGERKDLRQEEEYYLKALDINRKMRNNRFTIINLTNLGNLSGNQAKDLTKSIAYLTKP